MRSKKDKNTKKLIFATEQPVLNGRCDTITTRTSCLIPNSDASKIENLEGAFHLYFNNEIIELIVQHTNNKIHESIARHQENASFQENYCWMRPMDKVELDVLFGLMYFRGLLVVNLLAK